MCFYANNANSRARTVKGSITGFKRFIKRGNVLCSPFVSTFKWEFGKEQKELGFDKVARDFEVNVGFHCYKSLKDALVNRQTGEKVYAVTIPDGALVHENIREYCANKMIVEPYELKVIPEKTSKRKK